MKKRMIALAAALMLTATIGTVTAAAYGRGNHGGNGTGNRAAVCYQDTDGDGICDNCGTNGCGGNFVDEDGDGICDNRGTNGCGGNFVDEDGDGICDNRGTNGCGGNFVDEDGDGICDNCGGQHGTGRHAGGHHRNCQ